ncbi:PEP-CTERM sorting domain-containing protein [Ideonella alba]|uniref:PEP-CTERM sorting domain-containing protein n=1 Tax=Ideonella alba TaxID=2824118 RepID=A0A941BHM6_9BURK|nr:PEP-CTERM sorting domain-containing protein [Ideonella alba]MBQ0931788.1 PEP-CTERM sorting domain-containing protein [Ideonella alba]
MTRTLFALALAAASLSAQAAATKITVFKTSFDNGIPAQIAPGTAATEGVQGYAGLAYGKRVFGGQMLRSATGNVVTLTLTDLPAHRHLGIDFLFAAIDSLDGTGTFPSGDFLNVEVDGVSVFRESFANATESQVQSYQPSKPGFVLARRVDLGFSQGTYYLDSAYWLGGEPRLKRIAHTASSAVITFRIEGEGIQDLNDESWGMDALKVVVW